MDVNTRLSRVGARAPMIEAGINPATTGNNHAYCRVAATGINYPDCKVGARPRPRVGLDGRGLR